MIKYLSRPVYAISIIVILVFVTRIPQLINKDLILDGDECIVGLMGKHMYEGKEIPVYFYGQAYGFSLIETGFAAAGYALGGISDVSLKLSMLCLWLIGVIFFYYTLRAINDTGSTAFIITVLLVLCPAWAEWSMKARGGYITSFVLSSVVTWLLFNKRHKNRVASYLITGLLLFVIYKSQPLWLVGLCPLVIYGLVTDGKRIGVLYLAGGVVVAILLFYLPDKQASGFWNPHVFDFSFSKDKLAGVPVFILTHLAGAYNYPGAWTPALIFAWLFIITIIFLIGVSIYRLIKTPRHYTLFIVSCLSVLLTLSYSLILNELRYMLPLSGFVFMAMGALKWQRYKLLQATAVAVFIITGCLTLYKYRYFRINMTPKKDLLASIDYLKQHGVKYVFCTGSLLQWQLMFYSNESIIARFVSPADRYPQYVERVNKALTTERNKTSIYGFSIETLNLNTDSVTFLSDKYFVVPAPDSALLEYAGFRF